VALATEFNRLSAPAPGVRGNSAGQPNSTLTRETALLNALVVLGAVAVLFSLMPGAAAQVAAATAETVPPVSKSAASEPSPEARSALRARYAALYQAWEKQRDPRKIEAPISQLLAEQRLALGEQSVDTLLTERTLADVKYDLGELDLALTLAEHALAGLTVVSGAADTETLLARLVRVKILRDRARWREAALECEAVLALAEHNPDRRPWRWAQVEVMYLYDKVGRLGESAAIGERALREGSADVNDVIAAVLLDRLAGVYLSLARNDEALELQQRSQDLFVANYGPDHEATLSGASNLAYALWAVGRKEEVIAIERDIVRRRQGIADVRPRNALIVRDLLAEHLLLLGRLDEAEAEFRAVLPLWIEKFGPRDPDTLDVRYFLARVAIDRGQLAEASVALEEVCQAYEEIGDTYEGAPQHCHERLSNVLWRMGERERALQMLGGSLAGFEQRLETGHLSDRSQQSAFADRVPSFRRWAEWLIVRDNAQAAFAVSERLRARTLLQSIVLRHADASPALPVEESTRLAELKSRLALLDDAIGQESDPARRALLGAERDQVFRALADLRAALGKRYPAYAALSAVRTVTPAEAIRLLPANTAAVTYLIGDDRLFAFVLAPKRPLATIDLGPVAGLRESVEAAHVLMSGDRTRRAWRLSDGRLAVGATRPGVDAAEITDWQVMARELGRRLIAPLAPRLRGHGRWIIVPDGALALLPFEALQLDDRPLAATIEIRYVQSMSVLAAMQANPPRATGRSALLSVGAPDFAQMDTGSTEAVPVRADVTALVRGIDDPAAATQRAYELLQLRWAPLPGAAAEIARVRATFPDKSQTEVLTGRNASEPTLQRMEQDHALQRFRYIHVATHGYMSPTLPALSAIVLSPTDVGPGADGYLTAAELPAYHFDSDLIVLSACETGRGTELAGEGIMGLPYALFVAGNRSAMLTLWKVVDDSTARFVTQVFTRVAAGAAPAVALARTKREFLRDSRYAHPLHWAGFVLYGP
jgi:CHAT domain-containing protein/tetratricopeptide (TPR) repeat protein